MSRSPLRFWRLTPESIKTSSARAEDALAEVESFLDRGMRSGEESALIIHGHGTGALRQAIRDYLAASPYIRMFRPGENHEGGDGVTVVALRA